jgi:hypothetical protein
VTAGARIIPLSEGRIIEDDEEEEPVIAGDSVTGTVP